MNNMKRIIYIAIVALTAFVGCQKENKPGLADLICGEWRGSELSVEAGIYLNFTSDGTFELYQKLEGDDFELKKGSWSLSGDIISGKYSDGEPWATSYKVSVNGDVMTMVSQDGSAETNVYEKCEIPENL